ncbi:MAG: hypothetical protein IT240_09960 [Bacteroidia bacterium]|nr:hypothetical protein [Bacteroidia bacterium]MCC6769357.1 hypothetical protein [Bacteroidia bacterium]
MRKFLSLLVLLVFCTYQAQAQRKKSRFLDRCETIYGLGFSNFLGELGGADQYGTNGLKDLEMILTRPTAHLGFRYRRSPVISYKFNLTYGFVAGRDSLTRETFRENRNLSFRSPILETSLQFEVSILQVKSTRSRYKLQGVRGKSGIDINVYMFGGVGGFFFNPKAKYGGRWWALQPLGTEGQGIAASRSKYKRVQACFPVGFGFRIPLRDKNWTLGFEYGMRITTTDYIDDVSTSYFSPTLIGDKYGPVAAKLSNRSLIPSEVPTSAQVGQQRGDPTDRDAYMFGIVTLTYRLKSGRSVLPKFR